ncbi:MAG TPA: hypothetical protein VN282_18750 [Pyrinomonadaceae bacterium]|nr:hypothetical protein [Pyrinomonadaceae bacterium]
MEKNYWVYLFFLLLVLCAVLAFFLMQSSSEASYKKKYEAMKEQNERYKKRYDVLKKSYTTLAGGQTAILEKMMLEPDVLRKYVGEYADLKDNDELARRVRRDIGLLEAQSAQLDTLNELDAGEETLRKKIEAEEAGKDRKAKKGD